MNRRDTLARVTGAIGLNAALTRLARRPALVVLAYHRIGDATDHWYDDELYSATADGFRAQLLHLRRHVDLLSADALLDATRRGTLELRRPSALITFDDGYRDNCEVALPILRELGVPAVFFVAPGYIDRPRLTWWDRVAYIVKRTERPSLALTYPEPLTIDVRTDGRHAAIRQVLRAYKRTPDLDEGLFFARLEDAAGVPGSEVSGGADLFMTWDQVRTLVGAGMEVGAHTYDHPVLSRVAEDAQRHELSRSKQRIEEETGTPVRLMAYPVGGRDAFTTATQRIAAETGYRAAFSYYGGINRPGASALFDIRREAIDRDDSMPMFHYRMAAANLWGASAALTSPPARSVS